MDPARHHVAEGKIAGTKTPQPPERRGAQAAGAKWYHSRATRRRGDPARRAASVATWCQRVIGRCSLHAPWFTQGVKSATPTRCSGERPGCVLLSPRLSASLASARGAVTPGDGRPATSTDRTNASDDPRCASSGSIRLSADSSVSAVGTLAISMRPTARPIPTLAISANMVIPGSPNSLSRTEPVTEGASRDMFYPFWVAPGVPNPPATQELDSSLSGRSEVLHSSRSRQQAHGGSRMAASTVQTEGFRQNPPGQRPRTRPRDPAASSHCGKGEP
jgi:hypothetical protein